MSKALCCERPSRETFKLLFLLKKLGNPFEDDGECLFTLDSKVIVNVVVERLEERTKPINNPLRKNKCMCLCNNGIALKSSLTVLRNDCSLFSRLYIACQTRKGDLAEFLRHENQPPQPSLSKLGDKRTGKKANLLKCLERSPLPSGNADEEEVLADETNNIDYEETVDPVSAMISPF